MPVIITPAIKTIKLSFPQAQRVGNPSEELKKIPDKPE